MLSDYTARLYRSRHRPDLAWSVPVMRAGYVGRGLVYLAAAGFSLYAIWHGGRAQGTSSALAQLETTLWGGAILFLIFIGMFAFAIWQFVNSYWDLEDYGSDGRALASRIGMAFGGIVGLGIGVVAFSVLFTDGGATGMSKQGAGSGGDNSSIESAIATVMQWPAGRWIVGIAGIAVIGAGIAFMIKGWKEEYKQHVRANHFTRNWNWALKAGVIARGFVVAIIGFLVLLAAWRTDPSQAGGVGDALSWLTRQPYGQALVVAICAGLLGYALFCFVNAAYRVVPKIVGGDVETLAARAKAKLQRAT